MFALPDTTEVEREARDAIVVGGGLIGAAIAYGLAREGLSTLVLDGADRDFRAANANFGLVWVQGKGVDNPSYVAWTRRSARLWPHLRDELITTTGIDVCLEQPGGFHYCFDESELSQRARNLAHIRHCADDADYPFEILDRDALARRLPAIGPKVVGATFCPEDGHVNPLRLSQALKAGLIRQGGHFVSHASVSAVRGTNDGFMAETNERRFFARRLVLAAGLGNRRIGEPLGLGIPVRPDRGQILVTERLRHFLSHPSSTIRQTNEGTVLLGDSHEDAGFDRTATLPIMRELARRAIDVFPALGRVRLQRAWGGLRIVAPDAYPIYQESPTHPGAFVVSAHSGVTLAAVHVDVLAKAIAQGGLPSTLSSFEMGRFDVPTPA